MLEKIRRNLKQRNLYENAKLVVRYFLSKINSNKFTQKIRENLNRVRLAIFYKKIIGHGKLVFDVGANRGDKTSALLLTGSRVVSIEPQPDYAGYMRIKFNDNPSVFIEECGLGKQDGNLTLHISSKYPGFSSFDPNWQKGTKYHSFDHSISVRITTLDKLIKQHGVPYFCKIDVEGYEPEVFEGLSVKIPIINFEFHSNNPAHIKKCLDRLEKIGFSQFNLVLFENFHFELKKWESFEKLLPTILDLAKEHGTVLWGDIYAR